MSRTLLHDWEGSIERNKNNTEELLNIAEDIYNTAYTRGKASTKRPKGEWKETGYETGALGITYRQTQCSNCGWEHALPMWWNFCPNCGADMRKGDTK